jgi:hypothetical protein
LSLRSSTIHIFFMSIGASRNRETRNRDTMGERTRANVVGRGCLYYRNWEASKRGWRRHGWRHYQVDMYRRRGTLGLGGGEGRAAMRLVEVKGRRQSQAAGGGKKRGSDEIDGGRDDKSPFTVDLAWLLTRRLPPLEIR